MFTSWSEMNHVNSESRERYADELAAMAVLGTSLAAQQANSKVLIGRVPQTFDSGLKELSGLHAVIDHVSVFVAGFIRRTTAQRIAQEQVADSGALEFSLKGFA